MARAEFRIVSHPYQPRYVVEHIPTGAILQHVSGVEHVIDPSEGLVKTKLTLFGVEYDVSDENDDIWGPESEVRRRLDEQNEAWWRREGTAWRCPECGEIYFRPGDTSAWKCSGAAHPPEQPPRRCEPMSLAAAIEAVKAAEG